MTTATDGHLGFFRIPEGLGDNVVTNWTCFKKVQVHQSGIPCLSDIPVGSTISCLRCLMIASKVLLFTGGDDNAIYITAVTFSPEISTQRIASVPNAHASTITGVLSLGDMHFLSCGIDQTIKFWRLDGDKLLWLYDCHTCVPDAGGILEIGAETAKRRFVVFGTGMEMITWNLVLENGVLG